MQQENQCFHCGNECNSAITADDKNFCCEGCKTVYQIISENGLENFYQEKFPGASMKEGADPGQFDFLNHEEVVDQLLKFKDESRSIIVFNLPAIHCSSCIWLLENLPKVLPGVLESRVNFGRKEATITFNQSEISLRKVAIGLANIGYVPMIRNHSGKDNEKVNHWPVIKLAVAGFCFGNVMLMSFPEYFGLSWDEGLFSTFFGWINLLLSLPVLWAGSEYFVASYKSLKHKALGIDVPIAIGISALFLRSTYEVAFLGGAGFFDSLTGLVFFLLIGKWFQSKTYESLTFDRDYNSYFPLAVHKITGDSQEIVPINNIKRDDHLLIRNNEIVPADAILLDSYARINYSFVTGEERLTEILEGDQIYAGGKLIGAPAKMKVINDVSQSYLTGLWEKQTETIKGLENNFLNRVGKYFTYVILTISLITGVVWYFVDPAQIWNTVTAVLIIACPCALALSAPFTYGSASRFLGRIGFFLKGPDAVEKFFNINQVVFDKTGTLSIPENQKVNFEGEPLSKQEKVAVGMLASASVHPYSRWISQYLGASNSKTSILNFTEEVAKGISGTVADLNVRMGAATWVTNEPLTGEGVFLSINGVYKGRFLVSPEYREGITKVSEDLETQGLKVTLLSGDNASEKMRLEKLLSANVKMHFNQKPDQKKDFIARQQIKQQRVIMVGDGLNDAPSLIQSDIGISIAENMAVFTPASDVIMKGDLFSDFHVILRFLKSSRWILYFSIAFSFLYNIVGISLATAGALSPVYAAILMPLSSISVVLFATSGVFMLARFKYKLI